MEIFRVLSRLSFLFGLFLLQTRPAFAANINVVWTSEVENNIHLAFLGPAQPTAPLSVE
ncbi:MAG: hypothetical protein HW373_747, partial [Deltaproteobacteria bacterium]|nr:hypothetical protein [Deltaproteobacteria bacterium]